MFVWVFLAHCCHSEHSTLYTKDSGSEDRERKRERIEGGETFQQEGLTCLYCTEWRGWAFWTGLAATADVSALWDEGWGESETAMKSPGTTVYYQDFSSGSTKASEPAGGRDRGGRKTRMMTEVGS